MTTCDSYGNIRSKTGVGTYSYSNARPNAVSAAGGVTYAYDDNVNNTSSSDGRVITYNTFDKVKSAAKGGHTTSFKYGPDRARYKRIDTKSGNTTTTLYIGNVEKITYPNNTRAIKRYIDGLVIKTLNYNSGRTLTSTDTHYTLSDHLGSVDVITSGSGVITQQLSYDAWGLRRNAVNWQDLAASSITNFNTDLTRRGFTGHEHMDEVDIIHMNGRIYDPRLGRFLQADSFVPDPGNVASHNRYSYVYNNPLNATDPNGHFVFTLAAAILVATVKVTTLQVLVAFAVAGFADALLQGASFGEALKAGIISGVTAVAFAGVSGAFTNAGWASGSFVGKLSAAGFGARVAVHGVLGGISSMLSGGKFGHGFVSAGFTAAATTISGAKFPKALGKAGPRVVINATIGGTASKLSGRKFANGAVTAAFASIVSSVVHAAADGQLGSEPEHISDDVIANKDLQDVLTVDGNKISGTVRIASADAGTDDALNVFVKSANAEWNRKTVVASNGEEYISNIGFEASSLENANIVLRSNFNPFAPTIRVDAIGGSEVLLRSGRYWSHRTTPGHEVGYNFGLHHQRNSTNSIMSYSPTRSLQGNDVRRLIEAYR